MWPMAALPASSLLPCFLVICLNIQVCSALSQLVSVICMDGEIGVSMAIIVMVFEMCCGGYFVDMRKLPAWLGWVRYTSFYYYTFGTITRLVVAEPFGEDVAQKVNGKFSFSDLGYFWEIIMLLV